jgi:NAD(P)-dependent dehydrogenase (short-subunit alcohol dehydrogenase family)
MSIPSLSLAGKVALVTGARRGIGEAIGLTLAEAGANVAIADLVIQTGELGEVAKKIGSFGRRSLCIQVDVSRQSEVENMVQKVVNEFGSIDILVNNAGVGHGNMPDEPETFEASMQGSAERAIRIMNESILTNQSINDWEQTLGINLGGCYLCSQAVARIMIERKKGSIINISSIMAFSRGRSLLSPYNISKRGIIWLTEGLASDLAKHHIRVNAIAPGGIMTEMMRYVWAFPERLKNIQNNMPLSNSLLPPDACAHAALFFASDLSEFITGQTISVDAGLSVTQPM